MSRLVEDCCVEWEPTRGQNRDHCGRREDGHPAGRELDDAVLRVLRSGQYIGGAEIKNFEDAFAKSVKTRHAVGCNSGTDALILALRGLGIGAGDEVITASFSFFATAEAISAVGATPVFVDVDLHDSSQRQLGMREIRQTKYI